MMRLVKVKNRHKVDLGRLFGNWDTYLSHITETNYFKNLLEMIEISYKVNSDIMIPKNKYNVFKTFRQTDLSKLKVVILSDYPYYIYYNGIPFAEPYTYRPTPQDTQMIKTRIEKDFYKGIHLLWDTGLAHWGKQGVLNIPSSFTAFTANPPIHKVYWKHFTRKLLTHLSNTNEELVFVFLGEHVHKEFRRYVDGEYHYVIESTCPRRERFKGNIEWKTDVFNKVNVSLEVSGKEQINW